MGIEIGKLAVRRSIVIEAEAARVWKEFESLEAMQRWFGTGHRLLEYEPRVGGNVLLDCGSEQEPRLFGGTITVFDAERELTWDNDWIGPDVVSIPSMITLRLTKLEFGTLVELFDHGFSLDRTGARSCAPGSEAPLPVRRSRPLCPR